MPDQIYEQTGVPNSVGAGITVYPNALSALQALGVDLAQVRATRVQEVSSYCEILLIVLPLTDAQTADQITDGRRWHHPKRHV